VGVASCLQGFSNGTRRYRSSRRKPSTKTDAVRVVGIANSEQRMTPVIQLATLDDGARAQLALNALPDTIIGEVMPTTPGPATWTPQRVREFISFHESRRGGLKDQLQRSASLSRPSSFFMTWARPHLVARARSVALRYLRYR